MFNIIVFTNIIYSSCIIQVLIKLSKIYVILQVSNTNKEIYQFAKDKKLKFHMFAKIKVNGDDTPPLWKYLKKQKKFLLIQK